MRSPTGRCPAAQAADTAPGPDPVRLPVTEGDGAPVVRIDLRLPADLTVTAPPCITMPKTVTEKGHDE
ncbi:hypothetical protein OG871_36460 [Kitasatospora sp. NBC_00374]|uniref:hypothetical protein n=1 Tax=Kitasatospora sp. NBC_00374 TaxID=2975964 RepID=UPI0030E37FBA